MGSGGSKTAEKTRAQSPKSNFGKRGSNYTKSYECGRCTKIFKRPFALQRHEVKCDARVKFLYPGGVYTGNECLTHKSDKAGDLKTVKQKAWLERKIF